jgi:ribosomal protein S18 acetylase RimI-like enzyme
MKLRPATTVDLPTVAALHAEGIAEGFLSSLGPRFLERLYRRVMLSDDSFVTVATDPDDLTIGFVAGVTDLRAFYLRFLLRDGFLAGLRAAPRLLRAVPRVVETLRYPTQDTDLASLPSAELLSVAVAETARGRGAGRRLVGRALEEFAGLGARSVRVVTTTDNEAALAMYQANGFVRAATTEVHRGRSSEVLVWTASPR